MASVIGVAFEAGLDARVMTTSAFGSALVFWLAHWWSEVTGEEISAGEPFRRRDVFVVAHREWPLVDAAVVPTLLLALAWAGVCAPASSRQSTVRSASCSSCSRGWFTEHRCRGQERVRQAGIRWALD